MQRWWKPLSQWKPTHKYAINSNYLGDQTQLAWSNLGYWDVETVNYAQACQQLAERLAQAVQLNASDVLLDLGCGQGASLAYWQQHYAIQQLTGVELQQSCIEQIQQFLRPCPVLYTQSFLELAQMQFKQNFDVIMCIDAAYHSSLTPFLSAVTSVMRNGARLGFHYLLLTQPWQQLSAIQQQRYKYLLKAADVDIQDLMTQAQLLEQLQQDQLTQICIEDLSKPVLDGFANYAQELGTPKLSQCLQFDYLKIKMTAKLCRYLYQDGLIRYVQVSAQYLK